MANVIQFSRLGKMGRWGNQLFQFCFAAAYAKKHDCELQLPCDWIGRRWLVCDYPSIANELPIIHEKDFTDGVVNVDLFGHFQGQQFLDIVSVSSIKRDLHFRRCPIRSDPLKTIGVHLRRGDYLADHCRKSGFVVIREESYYKAFSDFGIDVGKIEWFGDYRTSYTADDEIADFLGLAYKQVIVRSNSTFAWWAAQCGLMWHNAIVYSPVIDGVEGGWGDCSFVEGNHSRVYAGTAEMKLDP